jgi:hypothetical protein
VDGKAVSIDVESDVIVGNVVSPLLVLGWTAFDESGGRVVDKNGNSVVLLTSKLADVKASTEVDEVEGSLLGDPPRSAVSS